MVGTINHIAIAVPCLGAASDEWRHKLDAEISAPQRLEEHGVTVVFIDTGNSKIELLEPIDDTSPIAAFLAKESARRHASYLF